MPKYKRGRSIRRSLFANDENRVKEIYQKETIPFRVCKERKVVASEIHPNLFLENDDSDRDDIKSSARTLPVIECWQSSDDLRIDKENCSKICESSPEIGGYSDNAVNYEISPILGRCLDDEDNFSISSESRSPENLKFPTKPSCNDYSINSSFSDGHINDVFSSPSCSNKFTLDTHPSPIIEKSVFKSNDWLKNVTKPEITPEKNANDAKLFYGSDRKRRKCVKGSLVEKLEKLTRREQADYAIWKHHRQKSSEIVDKSKVLQFKIKNLRKEFSHFYARCEPCNDFTDATKLQEKYIVIVPLALKVKLKLEIGNVIEIYPPWKTLKVNKNEIFILCANYIDVVDKSTEYFPLISECIYHHRCSCISDKLIHSTQCCNLSSMSRISSDVSNNGSLMQSVLKNLSVKAVHSILDALKMSHFSLIARVRRLFQYYQDESKIKKISVLIEDSNGFYAEIYPDEYLSDHQLAILKQNGEGSLLLFEQLRLHQKISNTRCPMLFSVIHTQQNTSSRSHPPNYQQFSYTLLMTRLSAISKCETSSIPLFRNEIKSVSETLQNTSEGFRCSFLVKVLYVYKENLFVTDDTFANSDGNTNYIKIISSPAVIQCETLSTGCVVFLKDLYKNSDCLLLDKYSRIHCLTCECETLNDRHDTNIDDLRFELLKNLIPTFKTFTTTCSPEELVILSGVILKPNEDDSYSWEICDGCANPRLREKPTGLFCDRCNCTVTNPIVKMHMEVFLRCSTVPPESHVRLTLKQLTIERILPETINNEQYDVECIVNKRIGPLNCYVQDVSQQDDYSTVNIYTLLEI